MRVSSRNVDLPTLAWPDPVPMFHTVFRLQRPELSIVPRGSECSIIKYLGKYPIFEYLARVRPKTVNRRFWLLAEVLACCCQEAGHFHDHFGVMGNTRGSVCQEAPSRISKLQRLSSEALNNRCSCMPAILLFSFPAGSWACFGLRSNGSFTVRPQFNSVRSAGCVWKCGTS